MTPRENRYLGALQAIAAMAESQPRINMPDGVSLAAYVNAVINDPEDIDGFARWAAIDAHHAPRKQRGTYKQP